MYMKSRRHLLQPILLFSLFATGCGLFDFSKERDLGPPPLLKAASTELSTTTITPHTYAQLDSLRNQVYCASFALAWNTAIDSTFGEPIVLEGPQETREMVEALNLRLFRNEYLDPDSYLALSGFRKDGILERIAAGLLEKFGEDAPSFDITLAYPESFPRVLILSLPSSGQPKAMAYSDPPLVVKRMSPEVKAWARSSA